MSSTICMAPASCDTWIATAPCSCGAPRLPPTAPSAAARQRLAMTCSDVLSDASTTEEAPTYDEVYVEPFGLPHKRIGTHRLPPFVNAKSVASIKKTWQNRHGNRYVILPQGSTAFDTGCLDAFVALAERKDLKQFQEELGTGRNEFNVPIPPRFFQRVLEMRVSVPGLEMPMAGPMGHSCFLSKLPPNLHPAANNESTDEKVVVLCADPRYLVMKEMSMRPTFASLLGVPLGPAEDYLADSLHYSQDLQGALAPLDAC